MMNCLTMARVAGVDGTGKTTHGAEDDCKWRCVRRKPWLEKLLDWGEWGSAEQGEGRGRGADFIHN